MNAIQFIKDHGIDKAREVVEGAPDKTATHYVISKRPHYYSVDFQSYFNNGDWHDSDYASEQDLANDYEPQNVIRLNDLKRLVESVDLIESYKGIDEARWYVKRWFKLHSACKQVANAKTYITDQLSALQQAIADYEAIGGGHV
ncbi:MAG: hypothetical protein RSA22_14080 [Acinetobacter sp.]